MARAASRQKLGYYPTPLSVIERLRPLLRFPERPFSVLDPCCGEGHALAELVKGAEALTYGIEIHPGRARTTAKILKHVLSCGYEDARISHGSVSILFLNPPYDSDVRDDDGRTLRTERRFLRDTHPYLVPGGVFIYLIAHPHLDPSTTRLLSAWFERLAVYRFPDPEYARFRQIVIIGVRKARADLDDEEQARLDRLRFGEIPALPFAAAPSYAVPPTPPIPLFRSSRPDPQLLAEEVAQAPAWRELWDSLPRLDGTSRTRPPLPLHTGHLGLLLAAGELDGIIGAGPERHLVRGLVRKDQISWTEEEKDRIVEHTKDVFRIRVKLLFPDGALRILEDTSAAAGPTAQPRAEEPQSPSTEADLESDTNPIAVRAVLTGEYCRRIRRADPAA